MVSAIQKVLIYKMNIKVNKSISKNKCNNPA